MRWMSVVGSAALLAACGGGGAGGDEPPAASTRNTLAATACAEYAHGKLGEKPYQLDQAALAASMVPGTDGTAALRGPLVINPGVASESKQTLECSVRFVDGRDAPDVLAMQFIW
jgi:hypothetical protein